MRDNEFEGQEQAQKAMKVTLPPLLDGIQSRTRRCKPFRWHLTWLERLPVTQEGAGSSPVAPANLFTLTVLPSKRDGLDQVRYADLSFLILSVYALVLTCSTRTGRLRLSGA